MAPTQRRAGRRDRRGFTLTELLTVVGLIALLISLFLPVLAKFRAAAEATTCLSNLRQMGTAWTMYTAENRGRLPDYCWSAPSMPDLAWDGYWLGILDKRGVRGEATLCPSASEPTPFDDNYGLGSATHAWTGRCAYNGTVVRFDGSRFRNGSYGYNRFLTAGYGFGGAGRVCMASAVRTPSDVPAFIDCAYVDVEPVNGSPDSPVPLPPTFTGGAIRADSPSHWKIMLARHGRGVNVCMADGSARWVALEDTYTLTWRNEWTKYRLRPTREASTLATIVNVPPAGVQ